MLRFEPTSLGLTTDASDTPPPLYIHAESLLYALWLRVLGNISGGIQDFMKFTSILQLTKIILFQA
jgi:hypothetical protein